MEQKSSNVCWAAAATMMRSWQNRQSMTVEAALDSLEGGPRGNVGPGFGQPGGLTGPPLSWRAAYEADRPLTLGEMRELLQAVGLTEEGPRSYTPEGLARELHDNGPLWVLSDDTEVEANGMNHGRIVTAVWGDGTPDGTTVTLADPADGTFHHELFTEFARRGEATDPVSFGRGTYHF